MNFLSVLPMDKACCTIIMTSSKICILSVAFDNIVVFVFDKLLCSLIIFLLDTCFPLVLHLSTSSFTTCCISTFTGKSWITKYYLTIALLLMLISSLTWWFIPLLVIWLTFCNLNMKYFGFSS